MNKKLILASILFITIAVLAAFVLVNNKKNSLIQVADSKSPNQNIISQKNEIILFYGDGCPHCAIVEEYISKNKIDDKISLTQKEVYYNQNNSKELEAKAKICGMPTDSIGVPFLWDGSRCIIGDQPIIDFFKLKLSQK
jgi:glutaredoxin